jgi:hypothetical protein
MKRITIDSLKAAVVFPAGKLPSIDPGDPTFMLVLGCTPGTSSGPVMLEIRGKVNAKAARRLAAHTGAAVLQGRLVLEGSNAVLLDGGFQFLPPKDVESVEPVGPTTQPTEVEVKAPGVTP